MPSSGSVIAPGIEIATAMTPEQARILTRPALEFVAFLERGFRQRRSEQLSARASRRIAGTSATQPGFLHETATIRADSAWHVAPPPEDLREARVEIVGAIDRSSVVASLNSGADAYVADFEDSTTPVWSGLVAAQSHLHAASRRTLAWIDASGREHGLAERVAPLIVCPRAWQREERHLLIDGQPCSGTLFDVGLHLHHNARELIARRSGPYFCLPRIEDHLEARLWNDVFTLAEQELGLEKASIRADCRIETLRATFEMEEILYELRDRVTALRLGDRNLLSSILLEAARGSAAALGEGGFDDPGQNPAVLACRQAMILACHRRGTRAVGPIVTRIPLAGDAAAAEASIGRVRSAMVRDSMSGLDAVQVAHPHLAPIARAAFAPAADSPVPSAARMQATRAAAPAPDAPEAIAEGAIRRVSSLGIQYLGAWLAGHAQVALAGELIDLSTAQLARALLRHWIARNALLDDGRSITRDLVGAAIALELPSIRERYGEAHWRTSRIEDAARLLMRSAAAAQSSDHLAAEADLLVF